MKVMFLGASVRKGTSEKTGNDYTIGELKYSMQDESSQKLFPDGSIMWTYTAHGHTSMSLPLDPQQLSKFAKVQPNTEVNLILEPMPRNPSRNWVTGVQ